MKQTIIDLVQSLSIILLAIAQTKKHSAPKGHRGQSGRNLADAKDLDLETGVPMHARDASGEIHSY